LAGTSGADSFIGQMDATATLNTLGLLDTFAAGEGTDSLTVINTTANAVSTALTAANVTGVETFTYSATGGGNLDFDTAGSATTFNLTVLGASDFSDVRTTDTVTIANGGATMNTTMTYNAVNVAGAADTDTIAITGITDGAELDFSGAVGTMTLDVNGDARLDNLVFDAATTSVTMDAAGALRVDDVLTGAGVTTYTATGAGAVTLTPALGALVTTYDASASTGAQTITMGATSATITTGTANDVVDMAGTLTSADTIDLGAGTDTLRVDLNSAGAAAARDLSISNVETLRFDALATGAGAIQMDNLVVSNIRFDQAATQGAADQVITLTDLATTVIDFAFTGGGELDDDVFFSDVTLDYDTTTDVANINLVVSNAGLTADDIRIGDIVANNVDQFTITATNIGQAAADELTLDLIDGDSMTDLVITADGELLISDIAGDVVDTIDMSGSNGGITVTALSDSAAAIVVTLGSGNDSFEVTDTAAVLTIDLGAGNDTFISDTGTGDTITTGAGSDTIRFIGDATDGQAVITDFTAGSGGDVIDLATNGAVITTAAGVEAGFGTEGGAAGANLELDGTGVSVLAGANVLDVTTMTDAGLATYLNAYNANGDSVVLDASGDDVYVIVGDGSDSALVRITGAGGGNVTIAAAEIEIICIFQGISDQTTLTAANFADFI
jgi:hypothetical protein